MSFGQEHPSQALRRAVTSIERRGIVLVAAAGNNGRRHPVDFPAHYPEVLAVTATNRRDQVTSSSSTGPEVDLAAPGQRVLSLAPGAGTRVMGGTSMAAPHVTGSAVLVRARWPRLTPVQIRNLLTSTAEELGGVGVDAQGAGLVRVDRALGLSD